MINTLKFKCWYYDTAVAAGSEAAVKELPPDRMPEDIREQIFSAFFTTKPVGEGTGLGLSITRSIIEEKHDGKIEVESKEGEFTRFIFLIPLTK